MHGSCIAGLLKRRRLENGWELLPIVIRRDQDILCICIRTYKSQEWFCLSFFNCRESAVVHVVMCCRGLTGLRAVVQDLRKLHGLFDRPKDARQIDQWLLGDACIPHALDFRRARWHRPAQDGNLDRFDACQERKQHQESLHSQESV